MTHVSLLQDRCPNHFNLFLLFFSLFFISSLLSFVLLTLKQDLWRTSLSYTTQTLVDLTYFFCSLVLQLRNNSLLVPKEPCMQSTSVTWFALILGLCLKAFDCTSVTKLFWVLPVQKQIMILVLCLYKSEISSNLVSLIV